MYQISDYIGDAREAKVRAEYAEKERKQAEAQKKLRKEKEAELEKFKKETEKREAEVILKLAAQQETINRLNAAIRNVRALQVRKDGKCENGVCDSVSLSDGWMQCFNASVRRSESDIKACETAGMYEAVSRP
jgi:type I site-specific restriction endonuclease